MTREESTATRDAEIDKIIDRFGIAGVNGFSRDYIRRRIMKAVVLMNMSYVMADVAHSFLVDSESCLKPLGIIFAQKERYYYNKMVEHITSARKWAEKSALAPYMGSDCDAFVTESDWWYTMARLIHDKIGSDARKERMVFEWLVNMPSDNDIFGIKMDDLYQKNRL